MPLTPSLSTRSPSAMATKKASKPQPTVTLKHLAAELAESHEVPKKQTEAMLGELVTSIVKHLKKGSRLRLRSRHSAGAPPGCSYGAQSGYRRADQNQGKQESRFPRCKRAEGSGLALRWAIRASVESL